jgi:CBS domain-containing protein
MCFAMWPADCKTRRVSGTRRESFRKGREAMLVLHHMTTDPIVIAPEDSLVHARTLMRRHSVRHLLVLQDGRLDGVITDRDIRDYMPSLCRDMGLHELSQEISRVHVDEAMKRLPVTISPEETIERAAQLFLAHRIGCLPVVSEGKVVGLITTSDVLRTLATRPPPSAPEARSTDRTTRCCDAPWKGPGRPQAPPPATAGPHWPSCACCATEGPRAG